MAICFAKPAIITAMAIVLAGSRGHVAMSIIHKQA